MKEADEDAIDEFFLFARHLYLVLAGKLLQLR